jgi:hypothetical protein
LAASKAVGKAASMAVAAHSRKVGVVARILRKDLVEVADSRHRKRVVRSLVIRKVAFIADSKVEQVANHILASPSLDDKAEAGKDAHNQIH